MVCPVNYITTPIVANFSSEIRLISNSHPNKGDTVSIDIDSKENVLYVDEITSFDYISKNNNEVVSNYNFLHDLIIHEDYGEISDKAKEKANSICESISFTCLKSPIRIANSIEGGIALVYGRKSGFLKRKYRELFLEVYNDASVAYVYTENYKLKDSGEFSFEDATTISEHIKKIIQERNI